MTVTVCLASSCGSVQLPWPLQELFPTETRAMSHGLAAATGKVRSAPALLLLRSTPPCAAGEAPVDTQRHPRATADAAMSSAACGAFKQALPSWGRLRARQSILKCLPTGAGGGGRGVWPGVRPHQVLHLRGLRAGGGGGHSGTGARHLGPRPVRRRVTPRFLPAVYFPFVLFGWTSCMFSNR
jgi:hypothetical protein